ncbi:MAG: hypothetical protein JWN46_2164 [Acidimicrobiales bacterium]|nr:hypothetical protein [Acidimicrobiales bacterium]
MSPRSRSRRRRRRFRALTVLTATASCVAAYRQRMLAQHQARAPQVVDRWAAAPPTDR